MVPNTAPLGKILYPTCTWCLRIESTPAFPLLPVDLIVPLDALRKHQVSVINWTLEVSDEEINMVP